MEEHDARDFSEAAISSRVRKSARRAEHWSESAPRKCHECGTSLRFSLAALSKKFSGVFGEHEAPVTTALLIANILMLGVSLA